MSAESRTAAADLARSIARAYAVQLTLRVLETLALGWFAAASVLAVLAWTAPGAEQQQAVIAAAIAGACCAAAWWLERAPDRRAHLRSADERMQFDGALVTAAGVGPNDSQSRLEQLLVARVAARARGRDLARASLPRTPLSLVAALLGAALLFAARDARSRALDTVGAAPPTSLGQALGAAAAALRSAAARASASGAGAEAATADVELARVLEVAASDPGLLATAGSELEERLIEAARAARAGAEGAPALSRALAALTTAREPGRNPGGSALEAAPGAAAAHAARGSEVITAAGAGASGSGASSTPGLQGSALAPPWADGRMAAPRSSPEAGSANAGIGATGTGPERGIAEARWWSPRYDRIVEAWLEPGGGSRHE